MDCIIAVKSQTYASRGGRILHNAGIPHDIVSIDPSFTRHGCAYGLRVAANRCSEARAVLKKHGFSYGDIIGGNALYEK